MSLSQTCVAQLYSSVIDDVINGVREYFLDEGVDDQVLMELKQAWENRLKQTKAVEPNKPDQEPLPPALNNIRPGGVDLPLDFNNTISVHISLPSVNGNGPARVLLIQVPAAAMTTLNSQEVLSGPVLQATLALPDDLATQMLQNHVISYLRAKVAAGLMTTTGGMSNGGATDLAGGSVPQVDGGQDTSDDDDDNEEDDDIDDEEDEKEEEEEEEGDNGGVEEEPLNSGDDVSDDDDPSGMFETDNVVVCQYDKITRSRNKWKFYLKDGIMNLGGKDFVFQKSTGDAEW